MSPRRLRTVVLMSCALALGAGAGGCEEIVELDRSAVVLTDAGCPICSDVTEEEDDAGPDAPSTDTGTDATDAGIETSSPDSGTGE